MTAPPASFERLHPAVQHHIVNTLGWNALRPTQEAAIGPILDGRHCMLLAPTAGGKTEAAVFPILSKMLAEDWRGLSVLYVCPIRALLNNLEPRLSRYATLVGRRVGLWHGDVPATTKKRFIKDPPDLLLTTPESLEGMMISSDEERRALLADVRLIVIDEMHAFCGDDRGWHLRCLFRRLQAMIGREIQVVGLTATVGNPEEMIGWMVFGQPATVVGVGGAGTDADIVIDYVGSLENAAKLIAQLHPGEKRLVFCDSRAKTEELAAFLRDFGVKTFVSHSSLSTDERRQAEKAFAEEPNCVIVATSTLELGIDVGDLDRVIQIDAPGAVASFLQRMGRTGRRSGSVRNCLFLATEEEGLLIACAIVRMWREGYVEAIRPSAMPWHLAAQQAMALVLQCQGLPLAALKKTLSELFAGLDPAGIDVVLATMLERTVLWEEPHGLVSLGPLGEEEFGRRHFEAIVSSFNSPMLLTVLYGQREIGYIDPMRLTATEGEAPVLILGGRHWRVVSTGWGERVVYVEPSENRGKASWLGSARPLRYDLCQTIKRILIDGEVPCSLSRRASERLRTATEMLPALEADRTTVERAQVNGKTEFRWWTFAGGGANFVLGDALIRSGVRVRSFDNFSIRIDAPPGACDLPGAGRPASEWAMKSVRQIGKQLKFSQCLPEDLVREVVASRVCDCSGARAAANQSRMHP